MGMYHWQTWEASLHVNVRKWKYIGCDSEKRVYIFMIESNLNESSTRTLYWDSESFTIVFVMFRCDLSSILAFLNVENN